MSAASMHVPQVEDEVVQTARQDGQLLTVDLDRLPHRILEVRGVGIDARALLERAHEDPVAIAMREAVGEQLEGLRG